MQILLENFPHGPDFNEGSFTSIYHEMHVWNADLYWKLDKEIYDLSKKFSGSEIPRNVAWPLVRVFSYLMMTIQAHHNPNDGFRISNLDDETVFNWGERLQSIVEGFFSGNMPSNTSFELVNPLIHENT